MEITIKDASYHRNGVCGAGFWAIIFDFSEGDIENQRMIASLFDEPGHCAVFSVAGIAAENITFAGGNSWRGDQFEDYLRELLPKWQEDNGTNRVGPFSL